MTTKKPDHPFAGLAGLRDQLPEGKKPVPEPEKEKKGPARAVVRLERKGRRGKETTMVEHLALPPAELERWCQDLKRSLGCGGVVEGATIVLQGDLRKRVEALLLARGVRKVVVSGP